VQFIGIWSWINSAITPLLYWVNFGDMVLPDTCFVFSVCLFLAVLGFELRASTTWATLPDSWYLCLMGRSTVWSRETASPVRPLVLEQRHTTLDKCECGVCVEVKVKWKSPFLWVHRPFCIESYSDWLNNPKYSLFYLPLSAMPPSLITNLSFLLCILHPKKIPRFIADQQIPDLFVNKSRR
jgi:hypothetical protein